MPVGGEDHPLIFAAPQEWNKPLIFAALRACNSAVRRSLDACAARGKVGPVMGLRPLLGPPCIPPGAPPEVFSFRKTTRATRLLLRELPSLATLAQVISLHAA